MALSEEQKMFWGAVKAKMPTSFNNMDQVADFLRTGFSGIQVGSQEEIMGAMNNPTFGLNQNNFMHFASDNIIRAQAERDQLGVARMTMGEQMAIIDSYRQLSGQSTEGYYMTEGGAVPRDRFAEAEYASTERSWWKNFSNVAAGQMLQGGASIVGAFNPEMGNDQSKRWASRFAAKQEGSAALAGKIAAGTLESAALLNPVTAGVGLATFAAKGAGQTRMDVAERRAKGEEISGLQEWGTAIAVAGTEVLSGLVTRGISTKFGGILKSQAPAIKGAFKAGGMRGAQQAIKSILYKAGGSMLGEGLEEAATQITQNIATDIGYADDVAWTEGAWEAGKIGGLTALPLGVLGAGLNTNPNINPATGKQELIANRVAGKAEQARAAADEASGMTPAQPEGMITDDIANKLAQYENDPTIPMAAKQAVVERFQADMAKEQVPNLDEIIQEEELKLGLRQASEDVQSSPVAPQQDLIVPTTPEIASEIPEVFKKMPDDVLASQAKEGVQGAINEQKRREKEKDTEIVSKTKKVEANQVVEKTEKVKPEPPVVKTGDQEVDTATKELVAGMPETKVVDEKQLAKHEREGRSFAQKRGIKVVYVDNPNMDGYTSGNVVFVRRGQKKQQTFAVIAAEISRTKGLDTKDLVSDDTKVLSKYKKKFLAERAPSFGESFVQMLKDNPEKLEKEAVGLMIYDMAMNPDVAKKMRSENPTLFDRIVSAIKKLRGDYPKYAQKLIDSFVTGEAAPMSVSDAFTKGVEAGRKKYGVSEVSGLGKGEIQAEEAKSMIKRADSEKKNIDFIMMDMANFKAVNEILGHDEGDKYLGVVGDVINKYTRGGERDDIGGWNPGGDEFVMALYDSKTGGKKAAKRIQDRINKALKDVGYDKIVDEKGIVTDKGGVVDIFVAAGHFTRKPGGETDHKALMKQAEEAMVPIKEEMKGELGAIDVRESIKEKAGQTKQKAKQRKVLQKELAKNNIDAPPPSVAVDARDVYQNAFFNQLTDEQKVMIHGKKTQADLIEKSKKGDKEAQTLLVAGQMGWIASKAKTIASNNPSSTADINDIMMSGIAAVQNWITGKSRRPNNMTEQEWEASGYQGKSPIHRYDPAKGTVQSYINRAVTKAMYRAVLTKTIDGKEVAPPEVNTEEVTETKKIDPKIEKMRQQARELQADISIMEDQGMTEDQIIDKLNDKGLSLSRDNFFALKLGSFLPARVNPQEAQRIMGSVMSENPKITGDPRLAQWSEEEMHRRFQDVIDELRKKTKTKETMSQWEKDGIALAQNPEDHKKIYDKMQKGESLGSAAETMAAHEILRNEASIALHDINSKDFERALALAEGYREGRTNIARIMRAGIDKFKRPGQRMAEFVIQSTTNYPDNVAKDIANAKKKGDAAEVDKIRKEWSSDVMDMLRRWKEQGIDLEKLALQTKEKPAIKFKIIRDIQKLTNQHGWWGPVQEYYRNALMYAPLTQIRNVLGGFWAVSDTFIVKPLARSVERVLGEDTSGETSAAWHAFMSGSTLAKAFSNMMNTMIYEQPAFDVEVSESMGYRDMEIYQPPAINGDKAKSIASKALGPAVGDVIGKAVAGFGHTVRIPQRLNAAVDQFVKTMHGHSEVAARAVRKGKALGMKPGSQEMVDYVDKQLADLSSDSWVDAMKTGETARVTFQGEAGWLEQIVISARNKVPQLGLLLPFIKTPVQIAKQAAITTPLGAIYMSGRAIKHRKGTQQYTKQEFSRHMAQQLLSMAALGAIWKYTGDDDEEEPWITGPFSYAKKYRGERKTKEQKYPPMSIKIKDKWYSYRNIEPFSTIIGTLVTVAEEGKKAAKGKQKASEAFHRGYTKLSSMFSDQTYLRAVGDVAKVIMDGETYPIDKLAMTIAGGWMPNFVDSALRAKDLKIREKRPMGVEGERPNFTKRLQREVLPTGDILPPPKVDYFGRDIEAIGITGNDPQSVFLTRFLFPFQPRDDKQAKGDKVIAMLIKWNEKNPEQQKWFQEISRNITIKQNKAVKDKIEEMNEWEYYLTNKYAGLYIAKRIENVDFNLKNPTTRDIIKLEDVFSSGREKARSFITKARNMKARGFNEGYQKVLDTMVDRIDYLSNTGATNDRQ